MFVCLSCGYAFPEDQADSYVEVHGETTACCPACGASDIAEAEKCRCCGGYFSEDDMAGETCNSCIEEKRYDAEFCYNVSIGENEKVEINAFLATILDAGDINQILWEYVKKNMPNVDCMPFIEQDKYWFSQFVAEEGRDK